MGDAVRLHDVDCRDIGRSEERPSFDGLYPAMTLGAAEILRRPFHPRGPAAGRCELAMTIQMVRTPLANRLPGIAVHSPLSETGSMQSVSNSSSHFGHGRYSRVVPLRAVAGTMLRL